ncbi:potassium channel family protein [Paraferrimonas haliotis]|uniref:Potassium transporter TrkA n=1 Tax=Paraferrimonas haliotis TaxID=2013866 RepID=A0AA37WVZ9_9GAMM|nr:TrkA family potassium uptake protein [Paraferrimonas haliotis]GLS83013.1 potassium transporter TrkA [Paraferrimonas haliotis]
MSHFTIIGLGRFGLAAAQELIHLGHTVTGVDNDPKVADKYVNHLTQVVVCDATDENALMELGLTGSDTVLVAIGEDMQASLLCTLALKTLGLKDIWVKANTRAHHTIVSKLGVARIIHPEEDMGARVAQALNYPMVTDFIGLGDGFYVVQIIVKTRLEGRTLAEVCDDNQQIIEPLLVKRDGEILRNLELDFVLQTNDRLLLSGKRSALTRIAPRLS